MKPTLRFTPGDRDFQEDLRRQVRGWLEFHRKKRFADAKMWAKAAFYFCAYWGVWALLCFAPLSRGQGLSLAFVLGLLGTGIALNIGHEASHSTFSRREWINSALYWISFNMLGTYSYLWKIGHLKTHHITVNVPGHDVGIEGNGAIRFANHTEWKPSHRHQHLYAPFLYTIYTLTWVLFRDWRMLREKEMSGVSVHHSRWRFVELGLIKILYFGYLLAIPMRFSAFAWTEVLIGFLAMHLTLSLYLAAMLFTSHLAAEPDFPEPNPEGRLPTSFISHQLQTTQDIYPRSEIANFFLGGFNSHAIHHLFPEISSTHYPELSGILKRTCEKHQMPYLETTAPRAIASHFRLLKRMSHPDSV